MKSLLKIILATAAIAPWSLAHAEDIKTATFAGGCFWCMEKPFEELPGVLDVKSGFGNGTVENPSYKQVSAGGTGHYEVVEVTYDADQIDYATILRTYWPNVDPFDAGGQFCDRGSTYAPAIFYQTKEEKAAATASKEAVEKLLGKSVVVPIVEYKSFYPAEEYHQDYLRKNPWRAACHAVPDLKAILASMPV
jgi:peptide-methionine (S)-S-oxide reductase